MSKLRIVLVFTLLLLVSASAFAGGSVKITYFSSNTFTTVVGARYTPADDCPEWDLWWRWGATSSFRKIEDFPECDEGGTPTVTCQIYNNGWVTVPCP